MARENHVRLRGVLPADPIIRESNDGKDAYAVFNVFVSRPNRVVVDKQGGIKKVNILVSSRNPGIVRVAKTLKKFDAVDINGVLTTKLIKKSSFCTYCGHKNMTMGTMVYVTPNYIEYISKVEDIKDALRYISDRAEISNTLRVIGEVMTEPKILHKTTGTPVDFTQYKLKLRRKMKIKEDDPKIGSDFPWVKSYGENAFPLWWIQHCHSYGSGCNRSSGSVPGLGISTCRRFSQKKKNWGWALIFWNNHADPHYKNAKRTTKSRGI